MENVLLHFQLSELWIISPRAVLLLDFVIWDCFSRFPLVFKRCGALTLGKVFTEYLRNGLGVTHQCEEQGIMFEE